MDYRKCLEALLDKNEGVLLTKDIVESGISKQLLSKYFKKGYIERVVYSKLKLTTISFEN